MTPTINDNSSLADIRALLSSTPTPEAEPATPTSEPATAEAAPEAAPEPAETQPEPQTEAEPELPEGVKRRIAKEAEKAARIQAEIDRAVSERKAKESELAKVKSNTGSEPAPNTAAQTDAKPKRPNLGEPGHENETWEQYQAREASYEEARDEWLRKETIREFVVKQQQEAAQKAATERWNAAVEKHGAEFPGLMESARALAPEGLQQAISALDNWSDVAVHLAKDTGKLKALAAEFTANPYKAIATLGRIEAALTSKTEPKPATTEKPLPPPLAKVGGSASASGQNLQDTLEKGSISQARAIFEKNRKKP